MSRRRLEEGVIARKLKEADMLVRRHGGYSKYVERAARIDSKEQKVKPSWLDTIAFHIFEEISLEYPEEAGEENFSPKNLMDLEGAISAARTDGVTRKDVSEGVFRKIAVRAVVFSPEYKEWLEGRIEASVDDLSESTK